jgi:hypothetical protein
MSTRALDIDMRHSEPSAAGGDKRLAATSHKSGGHGGHVGG